MKRLFKFRFPKLAILVLCIILAYVLFKNPIMNQWILQLESIGYWGFFIAGILVALGFTAPFAAGFLIASNPQNILLACLITTIGAVIADLLLFNIIRLSVKKEFLRLEHTTPMRKFGKLFEEEFGHKIKVYSLFGLAGLVFASPLPDEIGIAMMAGLTKVKSLFVAKAAFILHFIGIFVLLKI